MQWPCIALLELSHALPTPLHNTAETNDMDSSKQVKCEQKQRKWILGAENRKKAAEKATRRH
jgi:hypothetical protein